MKLIIDIPNRIYVMTKEMKQVIDADNEYVAKAIANGIPLPKGHGRLIDADELLKNKEKFFSVFEEDIGGHYSVRQKYIDDAPTIIEADKESEEEE